MSDLLIKVLAVIQAASAFVALFLNYKPGGSERTRRTAYHVVAASSMLAGVIFLMTGDMLSGAMIIATAVLVLTAPWLKRLVQRDRAHGGGKSTK